MANHSIQRAVHIALVVAGAAAAGSYVPSAAAQTGPEGQEIEQVVVTGSRIARPDLESDSPIVIISDKFVEQTGTVNVEQVLNLLPQVVPGLGSQVNNGGDGTATVDLRGLGATRTLVLINGRRFVPATNTGRTDLNAIPTQLIKRIDVVTGGASAVYGSDALAGVVNFILKDDFEGFESGVQYGVTGRGDAETEDAYVLLGANFADGKGNAVVSGSYYDRSEVFQDARKFSRLDLQGNGSATGPDGRMDNDPFNPFPAFNTDGNPTTPLDPANSNYAFRGDGTINRFQNWIPDVGQGPPGTGNRYNFSPVNYLVTPQTRYTLDAFLNYDLSDNVNVFAEMYYISNRSKQNLAPTPATGLVLPVTNPLLTDEAQALLASRADPTKAAIFRRRMVEFGPRINDVKFDTTQAILGARGDMWGGWSYETYYSFGRTSSSSGILGDISQSRLNQSLAGCPLGSGAQTPGCRVVDFFGQGKITPADVDFLEISSAVDLFQFDRHLIQAVANGTLMELPAGDLAAAVGYEFRKDASSFTPSDQAQSGDFTGFNAVQPIDGSFDVNEFYGEVRLPIVKDVPGATYLGLDAAARYSDYSSVGGLFSWKAGLDWRPLDQLMVRGTYAVANRAPSVYELYQAGDQSFPTVTDPCALIRADGRPNTVPSAQTLAICRFSGLPAPGSYAAQSNSQIEASLTGNTELKEETGDTYTAGLVWTPTFINNLSLTLDYYNIEVTDYVSRLSGGAVGEVQGCWGSGVTTQAEYDADVNCSNISRNQSGELLVTQPLVNSGSLATSGVDIGLNYALGLDTWGDLTFRLDANYLNSYEFDGEEYASQTSSDWGTLPDWRGNLRVNYEIGLMVLSANWNYIGEVDERPGDGGDTTVDAMNYFSLSGTFNLWEHVSLTVGANNLTDEEPPVILTGYTNTNTDNTTYDGIGRRYFARAVVKF